MILTEWIEQFDRKVCPCGKAHKFFSKVLSGKGVLAELPALLAEKGVKKVYLLADRNTYAAAGERTEKLLSDAGFKVTAHVFDDEALEPNEENVGSAVMYYPLDADAIVTVGSGVLNDIGKIVSALTGKLYTIVATAPSMDGYASDSSSMTRAGLKITLPSRAADIIVGDAEILAAAPLKMMKAGLGDMLAKYVSLAEWRIAHLLIGEYYCEEVAALVREALAACVSHADGLLKRDEDAALAVFDGLVLGGIAMKYAGVSRPASGVEHYISHVWDMRAVSFDTPVDFHGIQCAIGTLYAAKMYEKLKTVKPEKQKALDAFSSFDYGDWAQTLRTFLGHGAESMIALEAKEGKYDKVKHAARLDKIIAHWDEILAIVEQEIPSAAFLTELLDKIEAPKTAAEIGLSEDIMPLTFAATRDIRDKYVLSRLALDLGITEELLEAIR